MKELFRELTEVELSIVAGGYQLDGFHYEQSIDVVGRPYLMSRAEYEGNPEDSDPQRSDFGDQGKWSLPFPEWIRFENDADGGIDWVAQQVALEIKAMSDWRSREYGTIIYWTLDGDIRSLPLTRGMTVAEATAAGLGGTPQINLVLPGYLVAEGIKVLAVVHNHPDVGYSNALDLVNRYPSATDYTMFQTITSRTDVGTNYRATYGEVYAQYVLGPDGTLREFNFSDGIDSYATDTAQERTSRSNLARDR